MRYKAEIATHIPTEHFKILPGGVATTVDLSEWRNQWIISEKKLRSIHDDYRSDIYNDNLLRTMSFETSKADDGFNVWADKTSTTSISANWSTMTFLIVDWAARIGGVMAFVRMTRSILPYLVRNNNEAEEYNRMRMAT
ncbi:hypothetical protein WA026_023333 [Henosepilachna vigintioctopunctata]|uniref:Uncharacterized protein n=1 Tax=Henosepilachna vigintioctopunctata TaxID=420089 RepID=A0AAW1VCS4_9CUCU